jgi:hypothetical protein
MKQNPDFYLRAMPIQHGLILGTCITDLDLPNLLAGIPRIKAACVVISVAHAYQKQSA